jgi:hypothetical protein
MPHSPIRAFAGLTDQSLFGGARIMTQSGFRMSTSSAAKLNTMDGARPTGREPLQQLREFNGKEGKNAFTQTHSH